jgi:hypothetical protein
LHPLINPPSPLTNAGVLFNRHRINRAGTIEMYRAFEIEAVFEGLGDAETHDVIIASSSANPGADDPVVQAAPDSWRTTGAIGITRDDNSFKFQIDGADMFTVRLTNSVNTSLGLRVKFYVSKYFRSDS